MTVETVTSVKSTFVIMFSEINSIIGLEIILCRKLYMYARCGWPTIGSMKLFSEVVYSSHQCEDLVIVSRLLHTRNSS